MTQKPELILLVDDSDDDNYIHQRAIAKSGLTCQIDICTSGDDAMDYLTNQGAYASRGSDYSVPDLIFLDINMPRVNGWEFLDRYDLWLSNAESERPRHSSIILVMLSTSANPRDKERAAASRLVSEYMPKPLKPHRFLEVLQTYFPETSGQ